MLCLSVFLGAVIYLPWLAAWKCSVVMEPRAETRLLQRRAVGAEGGDIQLQALWKSKGFPAGDLVLKRLSWDTACLHHMPTTLMAWSPGQILPAAVESWLMGCAGLG